LPVVVARGGRCDPQGTSSSVFFKVGLRLVLDDRPKMLAVRIATGDFQISTRPQQERANARRWRTPTHPGRVNSVIAAT
jgi:hypothetical protein